MQLKTHPSLFGSYFRNWFHHLGASSTTMQGEQVLRSNVFFYFPVL